MNVNDLLNKLKVDSSYQEKLRIDEEKRNKEVALLREAEKPLVSAINSTGVTISSVYDLVNTAAPYPQVLPVLFEHLHKKYPDPIREGIARALAVKDARGYWEQLKQMYISEPESGAKEGMAVALTAMADKKRLPEIVHLISNRTNGPSRIHFVRVLSRSKDKLALDTLIRLKDDCDMKTEVQERLKRKGIK